MIVLDTNVVSELMRPSPNPSVLAWLRGEPSTRLFTTSITAAEVRYGIARLPDGQRKDRLLRTAEEVFDAFSQQVLPFDGMAAAVYGDLVAHRERRGRPIDGFDAQIAAICRVRGATLATRNRRDFEATGVVTADPWSARVPG